MKKELNLGKDKIGSLLLAFSVPCIISMLINSIYNIVDQIFIGQGVGYLGNAATNVIFPIVIFCNAVAGLIGNGCAANLSLRLGEKKEKEASKSVASTIVFTIILGVVISLILYLLLDKLVLFFGCTEKVLPYAISYGKIILLGAPFMIIYSVLSQIIRADGSPKYSMILLVLGAVINLILDPILIMGFNMGVKGGAIATIIGQIASAIMALMYIKRFKQVKIDKKDFAIIEALNSTKSIADMFDFDILEKLSGLDGKQMKKDIVMCVDERKFMLPMIYINYRALGISMHMYLVRMFQNVPSYRKAEIVDEFSLMPEFVDILQFGDSFYDCMLTVYTEVNDVEAIRRMLEGYAEIEEVKVANSKRQFRRWVARLDDDNGYWEECVMTDDFLQNRLESGSVKCRFSTDSEEVQ